MDDVEKRLLYYLEGNEGQYLERKSARIEPKDILRPIIVLANAEGGDLIIGVEDDGNITGFQTE